MKNLAVILPLLIALILIEAAQAQDSMSGGAGNGGDGIVCEGKEEVILLDTNEAINNTLTISLENPNISKQTHRSMVEVAVSRLMKKDIKLAESLSEYALEMVVDLEDMEAQTESIEKYTGKNLIIGSDIVGEINDSFEVSLPEGCVLKQLVSQRKPIFRLQRRYQINKTLWDRMNLQEQSMTILYEAWYRIMIENGARNSIRARYMNGLIASKEFEDISFLEYFEDLSNTEVETYTLVNTTSALSEKVIVINLKEFRLEPKDDKMCAPMIKLKTNFKTIRRTRDRLPVVFKNVCFKNSRITSLELRSKFLKRGFIIVMTNYFLDFSNDFGPEPTLLFHKNGMFAGYKDLILKDFYKMFYKCQTLSTGEDSCTGPYLDKPTRQKFPGLIEFGDNEEAPIL